MITTNWKHLKELTNEDFKVIEKIIKEEKDRRENEKRIKLYTAFKEAWKAIEAEGFSIRLNDRFEFDSGDNIYFDDIDID